MRYKLSSGIVIKTENAAKPSSQPSKFLVSILGELQHVGSVFDYGCGKLRYAEVIAERSDFLAVVDSEIQLSRQQTLRGKKTSIRGLFEKSNQVMVLNDIEFEQADSQFDRGFCINVLSAIPSYSSRRRVLKTIRGKLRPGGECLFVVQYRNSDFTRMKAMPKAIPWLDGFILNSLRGYSFYGMILPHRLEASLQKAGFSITRTVLNDGSAYVWASAG